MRAYLVRHGEALEAHANPARPLSELGRTHVHAAAALLHAARITLPAIWHSELERARETAQILAHALLAPNGEIGPRRDLRPDDDFFAVYDLLLECEHDCMLVGHLPYMQYLASKLLCGDADRLGLAIHPATILCIERHGTHWHLRWMLNPEITAPRH
jgi:phosphohistidine phosphatase